MSGTRSGREFGAYLGDTPPTTQTRLSPACSCSSLSSIVHSATEHISDSAHGANSSQTPSPACSTASLPVINYDDLFENALERSLAHWRAEEAEREALWDTLSTVSTLSDLSDLSDLSNISEDHSDTNLGSVIECCTETIAGNSEADDSETDGSGMEGVRNEVPSNEGSAESDGSGGMVIDEGAGMIAVVDGAGDAARTGEKRKRDDSSGLRKDGTADGLTRKQRKKMKGRLRDKEKKKQAGKERKVASGVPLRGPKTDAQKNRDRRKKKQKRAQQKAAGLPRKYSEATKERRRQRKAFKRALKYWVGTLGPDGYRAPAASERKWGEAIEIPTEYDASELSKAKGAYVGKNRPVDKDGIDDDFTLEKAKAAGAKYIAWDGV